MRYLLLLLAPIFLLAAPLRVPLETVKEGKATVTTEPVQKGQSGYVLRQFNDTYSAIIANVRVTGYDASTRTAQLKFTPYEGLEQSSLPQGKWSPKSGDIAVLSPYAQKALIITPDTAVYRATAERTPKNLIHPDQFAAFLSLRGHPTPLKRDFESFCDATATGLLYLVAADYLFTLECSGMKILGVAPQMFKRTETKLPFYSRVPEIESNWFGEGSGALEAYDPYYLELLRTSNPKHPKLNEIIKGRASKNAASSSSSDE